ncbi:hypothetical protein [Viridibacillus arvi]|uniref:hypothetical protein n=1 Tax=Viridibacillus arvi TaxID=263475 RepID=UPI0036E6B6D3
MINVDWFAYKMKKVFRIDVEKKDVSFEAYEFEHEDIDDLIVPSEHLVKLPNPLLFKTFQYVDDKRNDWIASVVLGNDGANLYEVWIKNGKSIAFEMHIE